MSSFDDRKKSFEKKFANEQELQFKITGRRNRYFGKWAAEKLNKKGQEIETYVNEVMRADLKEPGDMDLIGKVQKDLDSLNDLIAGEADASAEKQNVIKFFQAVGERMKSFNLEGSWDTKERLKILNLKKLSFFQ